MMTSCAAIVKTNGEKSKPLAKVNTLRKGLSTGAVNVLSIGETAE